MSDGTIDFSDYSQVDQDSIESLDLMIRTYNCLRREGVTTVSALAALTENQLLEFRNFGQNSVDDVKVKLADRGLHLRPLTSTGELEIEHVTIYRCGGLQVTVNGDGSGHLSLRDLSPTEMDGLKAIMRLINPSSEQDEQQHDHYHD
jgi:hypothetical protein